MDVVVIYIFWKLRFLEFFIIDCENVMLYVIVFDVDGIVKDVMRRYVKVYVVKMC